MRYSQKIIATRPAFKEFSKLCRRENRSLVLCRGHFNVIHPGHMRFLHHAKRHGVKLMVAIISDIDLSKSHPVTHCFNQLERASSVAGLECVDHVLILDELNLLEVIGALPPLTFALGQEFEEEQRDEVEPYIELVRKNKGRVIFHSGEITYSSSELFHSNVSALQKEKNRVFQGLRSKLKIRDASLHKMIERFKSMKLLVIGDAIVDQFVACDALGMSAEGPIIVLREIEANEYVGGAAIIAAHVRALGAECHFVSAIGDDRPGEYIKNSLREMGIISSLFVDIERPSTYKVRYMVDNQKMFRVSRLEEKSIPSDIEKQIISKLLEIIPEMDGVIIGDFVYGVITPKILESIISTAKQHHVRLFGDLQCSSQIGNVLKFKGFDLITPTEREARIALGDHDSGLEKLAVRLLDNSKTTGLIITLGANGFIAYHNRNKTEVESQHFPALCANPIDVSGAGDTLISAIALGICADGAFMESAALGACAAAIAVNRIGNIPLTSNELKAYLREILPNP